MEQPHPRLPFTPLARNGGDGGDFSSADPIRLEIFNNLFMSIAEQMGFVLEQTAVSVNIKERLDFSCAIFDPDRQSGGECAAHAGAFGQHERKHQGGDQC